MEKKKSVKENFSKNLEELRNIAIAITRDKQLKLQYDEKAKTCSFDYATNTITLTTNAYPDYAKNNERIAQKILDSSLMHEALHYVLSKPLAKYFESWVSQLSNNNKEFPFLAREIINVGEDKRVNYYGKNRFRFDLGKRQVLKELIFKDVLETNMPENLKNPISTTSLIVGAISGKTLYNVDITPIRNFLTTKECEAIDKCLDLMEKVKYSRLRIEILSIYKQIYEIIKPFAKEDNQQQQENEDSYNQLMLAFDGGKINGNISKQLQKALDKLIKAEIEAEQQEGQKLEQDLKKNVSAGMGTGEEIPSPEPDILAYENLVGEVKPEIDRLLSKLKLMLKPKIQKDIYQKRGRIMSNILTRCYTNSLRKQVSNVYVHNDIRLEKEKINIAFLVDFSGSVSKTTALRITTIFNEVFGNFVDDYSFGIGVFAQDIQKIKTFFEQFYTTRARIPNISVNASGTRIHDLIESFLKMFNGIREDRRKILVIASDFCFSDEEEAKKVIEQCVKSGIEVMFVGFSECYNLENFAKEVKGIKRTKISDFRDLPEAFIDIYLNVAN
jgi:hypothetical protein